MYKHISYKNMISGVYSYPKYAKKKDFKILEK